MRAGIARDGVEPPLFRIYRGAFLLNYALAVGAVFLATLSLVLLAIAHVGARMPAPTTGAGTDLAPATVRPGEPVAEEGDDGAEPRSGFSRLSLRWGWESCGSCDRILQNTDQANHGDWNDKAVDYRYLAERLRTMFYLPRIGSFQPPAAATHHYLARDRPPERRRLAV